MQFRIDHQKSVIRRKKHPANGTLDRRSFNQVLMSGAGLGFLRQSSISPSLPLQIDSERLLGHLRTLATISDRPAGSGGRVAFGEADLAARQLVRQWMAEAGLETRIDAAGNLLGSRPGRLDLPPLMFGSHIDSVPEGGSYDGPVGSISAIEVAHTLKEQEVRHRHPLEVVVFSNEEGGKTGSRALIGEVEERELELPTASGKTIGEGLAFVGGDPTRLPAVLRRTGDIAAYLELHIEQGAVLATRQIDIGVVEGIVGIKRWEVTVQGKPNHAGTTPMDQRQDALVAASAFAVAVHETARRTPGRQVATVGRIEAEPGAANVIPGRVKLSLEIRDLTMDKIDSVFQAIQAQSRQIAVERETRFSYDQYYVSFAAPTDERIRRLIEGSADALDLSRLRLPSGAGHDAQSIAKLSPVGMIFVPSRDGISHSPLEFTPPGDIINGANVLTNTLLALDQG